MADWDELCVRAELGATGANIHDVRGSLYTYRITKDALCVAVAGAAAPERVKELQRNLRRTRRVLELVLAGKKRDRALVLARDEEATEQSGTA